jgi:hypothetical protein
MKSTHKTENLFSLGSQVGGSDAAEATQQDEQELRDLLNEWTGEYSDEIREFAFLLTVDGEIDTYTKRWNIHGAQKAKRKKDWIEIEIGVPENWWREDEGRNYKRHLAAEIEKALHSIIELLQKNRWDVKAEALLTDWGKLKERYLGNSTGRVAHPPSIQ